MSRRILLALTAVALALTLIVTTAVAAPPQMFVTPLSGDEEVPPRDTQARGVAIFQLSPDGEEMSYRLIASNIENVVASHIHIGPPSENGPVVVFLFGTVPAGGGRQDGVLATGSFTEADFVGPFEDDETMADLVAAITSGNAYVNVHTDDGDSTTTIPSAGDFPGGEIRGQLD